MVEQSAPLANVPIWNLSPTTTTFPPIILFYLLKTEHKEEEKVWPWHPFPPPTALTFDCKSKRESQVVTLTPPIVECVFPQSDCSGPPFSLGVEKKILCVCRSICWRIESSGRTMWLINTKSIIRRRGTSDGTKNDRFSGSTSVCSCYVSRQFVACE